MPAIENNSKDLHGPPDAPRVPGSDPFLVAAGSLRREFEATCTALRRSLYVERQALGLSIFDGALRLVLVAIASAMGLAAAIAAVALLVTGLRRGLALWSAGAWWADLVLGLALVVAVATAAHCVRRRVHRSVLAQTQRELARPPAAVPVGDTGLEEAR